MPPIAFGLVPSLQRTLSSPLCDAEFYRTSPAGVRLVSAFPPISDNKASKHDGCVVQTALVVPSASACRTIIVPDELTHSHSCFEDAPVFHHGRMYVVVVLTSPIQLTHRFNAVGGHRTGANSSGADDCLRRKTDKNRRYYGQLKQIVRQTNKKVTSAYVRIKIIVHIIC